MKQNETAGPFDFRKAILRLLPGLPEGLTDRELMEVLEKDLARKREWMLDASIMLDHFTSKNLAVTRLLAIRP